MVSLNFSTISAPGVGASTLGKVRRESCAFEDMETDKNMKRHIKACHVYLEMNELMCLKGFWAK
jgi:hypothetical protein